MSYIQIVQGDITSAKVDAIVNAANSRMLGGGGVDGAIHRAAGPELLAACRQVPVVDGIRCPVGEARMTQSGRLHCQYVIHTVGPVYHCDVSPAEHLASAYRNSLHLASEHLCHSVAFPAISCGVYGYPHQEAAEIALATCRDFTVTEMNIIFYLLDVEFVNLWQTVCRQLIDFE
ncbi:MAG: O-acetyl-ADP-ribose deacetylase [Candidatus Celerinatantimonas neptuna]|nr:MAG: O-acetyl-ADP-ribose deacetylase [Candidatus Celerinatantimonas neptuna]